MTYFPRNQAMLFSNSFFKKQFTTKNYSNLLSEKEKCKSCERGSELEHPTFVPPAALCAGKLQGWIANTLPKTL